MLKQHFKHTGKGVTNEMTPFEAWKKACEELNHSIYFLDSFKNRSGDIIELYLLNHDIPSIKINGLDFTSEIYYILWINRERFWSYTNYRIAVSAYERRRCEYLHTNELRY